MEPKAPIPLLDLKAQSAPLREAVDAAIRGIVDSQYFVLGHEVEGIEQEVVAYTGAAHAIGCASGTDALILSLAALGIGDGDRVLTSPFSFFSSASCAYKVGARPAFADIDPDTFNLDPESVRANLTDDVRALMPGVYSAHRAVTKNRRADRAADRSPPARSFLNHREVTE